jgi:uncharacterized membrane protein
MVLTSSMSNYSSPHQYVRQVGVGRSSTIVWLILLTISVLLIGLIIGAPIALATGHPFLGLTAYQIFSPACHQLPERSFTLSGHKFAVCARCTGLYAGFASATLLYPLLRSLKRTDTPPRTWLLVAAFPLALDFGLTVFGIWENTHWSRFLTGVLLGSVAVFYVLPGLVDLVTRRVRRATTRSWSNVSGLPSEHLATAPSDYSSPHRRI